MPCYAGVMGAVFGIHRRIETRYVVTIKWAAFSKLP